MLDVDLGVKRDLGGQELLAIGFPAFVPESALVVDEVEHAVDAFAGMARMFFCFSVTYCWCFFGKPLARAFCVRKTISSADIIPPLAGARPPDSKEKASWICWRL